MIKQMCLNRNTIFILYKEYRKVASMHLTEILICCNSCSADPMYEWQKDEQCEIGILYPPTFPNPCYDSQ